MNANAWRGDSLARLDRAGPAEDAFRREIAAYPANPEPYRDLILLYTSEARTREAARVVLDLERAAPVPGSYVAIASALLTVGDPEGARFWRRRGLHAFPGDGTLLRLTIR